MTRRLWIIVGLGVVAVLVSGALALDERRPVHQPEPSATGGVYSTPEWLTMQQRYGAGVRMIVSMAPMSVLESHGCLVVLRGLTHVATVCRPTAALRVFTWRSGEFTNVVGVTPTSVASVVVRGGGEAYGAALMQVARTRVFATSFRHLRTLTAADVHGRVVERLRVH
ncbi:MAG: hypothetical protein ABUS54_05080 [Actinomycetota bacterium]